MATRCCFSDIPNHLPACPPPSAWPSPLQGCTFHRIIKGFVLQVQAAGACTRQRLVGRKLAHMAAAQRSLRTPTADLHRCCHRCARRAAILSGATAAGGTACTPPPPSASALPCPALPWQLWWPITAPAHPAAACCLAVMAASSQMRALQSRTPPVCAGKGSEGAAITCPQTAQPAAWRRGASLGSLIFMHSDALLLCPYHSLHFTCAHVIAVRLRKCKSSEAL